MLFDILSQGVGSEDEYSSRSVDGADFNSISGTQICPLRQPKLIPE